MKRVIVVIISILSLACTNDLRCQLVDFDGDAIIRELTPQLTLFDDAASENRIEGTVSELNDNIIYRSYIGDLIFSANSSVNSNDLRIANNTGRIGLNGLPSNGARMTIHEDAQAIRLDGDFTSIGWYDGSTAKAEAFVDNSSRMTIGTIANSSFRIKTNNLTRFTAEFNGSIRTGFAGSLNGHAGALLLCDSDPLNQGTTVSGADDQFVARFVNGYYFMTSGNSPRTGIVAGPGANAWSSISDINRKENFEMMDDVSSLEKIASVEFSSWNYKGQDPKEFRHYGIMAQDFHKHFGKDSYGEIGSDELVNSYRYDGSNHERT